MDLRRGPYHISATALQRESVPGDFWAPAPPPLPLVPFSFGFWGFWILLRDPHPSGRMALFFVAWIFVDVFLHVILHPFFYRFLVQLGSNLAPNLAPKSTKNRSKSRPNSILTCILFSIAFWIDFGRNFHRFSTLKSTKNQPKFNQKINPTSQQPKNKKVHNYSTGPMKSCPRPCYVGYKNV